MATRLYPDTEDATLLEQLAGVPAGTAEALARFQAERRAVEALAYAEMEEIRALSRWCGKRVRRRAARRDPAEETYDLREAQPALAALYDFQLYGWGRLGAWRDLEEAGHDPVVGATDDPHLLIELLYSQPLDRIPEPRQVFDQLRAAGAGLCWC